LTPTRETTFCFSVLSHDFFLLLPHPYNNTRRRLLEHLQGSASLQAVHATQLTPCTLPPAMAAIWLTSRIHRPKLTLKVNHQRFVCRTIPAAEALPRSLTYSSALFTWSSQPAGCKSHGSRSVSDDTRNVTIDNEYGKHASYALQRKIHKPA